jgi:hypothetical protein
MTFIKDAKDMVTRPGSQVHWVKLLIALIGLVAISFGFAELFNLFDKYLISKNIVIYDFQLLAYASVFFFFLTG